MLKFCKVIFFLFTLSLSLPVFSWQEYHGGNDIVIEFNQMSLNLLSELNDIPISASLVNTLKPSLDWVKITPTSHKLILNNDEKAILVRKKTSKCENSDDACELLININKWKKLTIRTKEMLVLHELFNLSELTSKKYYNEDQYKISRPIYENIIKYRFLKSIGHTPYSYIIEGFKLCSANNFHYAKSLINVSDFSNSEYFKKVSTHFCNDVTELMDKYSQGPTPLPSNNLLPSTEIKIYRTRNGNDYLITPFETEGLNYGYVSEAVFIFLGRSDFSTKPIYRCRGFEGHFISVDPNCEGQTVEGILAHLSVSNNSEGTLRPIYRLKTENGNYLISYNKTEGLANGWFLDGLIGYGI